MTRASFVVAVLVAGCGGAVDPCAGKSGVCIGVHLDSTVVPLDQLEISVDRPSVQSQRTPSSPAQLDLPVRFAILLPAGTSGTVQLSIDGLSSGERRAHAATEVVLPPSGTAEISLTLSAASGDGGALDLAGAQDLAPADLAGADLAGVDLAGIDLAPPVDLAGQTTVTVTVLGDGTGTLDVDGVACNGGCVRAVTIGGMAVLQATPTGTSVFGGWSGACSGVNTLCNLVVPAARSVSATFKRSSYDLTVARVEMSGGGGTSVPSLAGVACGPNCLTYPAGATLMITETPNGGSSFLGWGGDFCRGSGTTCNLTMSSDHLVTESFSAGAVNYAFVTSSGYNISSLMSGTSGVLAAADALCQGSATAGGLPSSTYKAWLSVGATDAISRFAGARAWVRPDGMPFADTLAGLASGQIFYPLAIDEQGGQSSRSTWTGTNAQGTASGVNCTDFTVSAATGFTTIGDPRAGGALFSAYFTTNCSLTYALYCLGTTSSAALGYTFAGRRAFVSSGTMIGSAGVATGDALCSSEAGLASLAGTFRAFLDTAALPARSRFDTSLAPWVRADGTLLSVSAATFDPLSVSQLAPLSQHADGNYLTSLDLAWIGGPGQRCADWTSAAGNGLVGPAAELAQISSTDSCSTSHPVFCLQQ